MKKFESGYSRESYDKLEQDEDVLKTQVAKAKSADEIISSAGKLMVVEEEKDEMENQVREEAHFENTKIDLSAQIKESVAVGDTDKIIELAKKMKEAEEQIREKRIEHFMFITFRNRYGSNEAKAVKQKMRFAKPETLNYEELSQDEDITKRKFGEYTLNPDTQNIDFEKAKVFIPDLSQFVGKRAFEAIEYVVKTYSATHHIPGIEYWKWIIENPDKALQIFKDKANRDHFNFIGSVLRDKDHWEIPYVTRMSYDGKSSDDGADGGRFDRNFGWFFHKWGLDQKVVLFEKQK